MANIAPSSIERIVHVSELPSSENAPFTIPLFSLKTQVVSISRGSSAAGSQSPRRSLGSFRPPPVLFEKRGLIVKYGSAITIAEAQCLWYFNQYMKQLVPAPGLFGWCRDGHQTFIYTEVVRGDTLEERWPSLSEDERTAICEQLRRSVIRLVSEWLGVAQGVLDVRAD